MYQCNYCKRFLKEKYKNCPGCGSTSFLKVASYTEQVIKTPPEGGYKVKITNYKFQKQKLLIPIIIVASIALMYLIFNSIFVVTGISLTKQDSGDGSDILMGISFILFALLAVITSFELILFLVNGIRKDSKNINSSINKIKKLTKQGILIKNLPYELKMDKSSSYTKPIYRIKVLYEIEKGRTLSLQSEPKHLTTLGREDGTVDLLIDPDDYSNYFIDFEIY